MTTAYTPLETLLLFQALRCEGRLVDARSFNDISDQLQSVRLVREDPAFDSGRLRPDALRERYLWLLKEEAKADLEQRVSHAGTTNGDTSPGSRKRKAPSPTIPSVQEASKHAHLIPQLVTRLYTRYRETVVRDLREHERRYDSLKRDINEIETGRWDERLQRQRSVSATQSPRPTPSAQSVAQASKADYAQSTHSATASPSQAQAALGNRNSASIHNVMNHGPDPQNGADQHRRTTSNATLPPVHEMAPHSPHLGIPPRMASVNNSAPMQNQGYSHAPSSTHPSPYAPPHPHPMTASAASPQLHNSISRPSSSPRPILPPPAGLKIPPSAPGQQQTGSPNMRGTAGPSQTLYGQPPPRHRMSTGPTTPNNQSQQGGYRTPQMYQQPGYYQQQPYADNRRPPYSVPPQQPQMPPGYMSQPPHAGGYQLPPFSVDPQEPIRGKSGQPQVQPQRHAQAAAAHAQRAQYPQHHPPHAPATLPRAVSQATHPTMRNILGMLGTPPRNRCFRPPRNNLPEGDRLPKPSPIAEPMPVSPMQKNVESTRSSKKPNLSAEDALEATPVPKNSRRTGRNQRARSPHSVVSSNADESVGTRRSQSVNTTTGPVPASEHGAGDKGQVKAEPSTPADTADADGAVELASAAGSRTTRKRRGTLTTQTTQPHAKRKRLHSPSERANAEAGELETPPPKPNTVLATRNFHKIAAAIMLDINSHKHASYFANPVREKDAPGYSEIIKKPQSLKSIKTAISVGNRAVIAAPTHDSPTATSSAQTAANTKPGASFNAASDSTTVELEAASDLVPPKGIVNAAQLEKELMRTFANAVMFNPGEDGMVSDTREIFADVEEKLREWRGAEKGDGEEAEMAGRGASVEEEGKGKRRKG